MWQQMIEHLTVASEAQGNAFWTDVDRETEHAILHQLFSTALARNVLSNDQVEQFLFEIWAMNAPAPCKRPATIPQWPIFDLDAATRNLLEMDEKLSPLGLALFERPLLTDLDRETLKRVLGASRRPVPGSPLPCCASA